MGDDKVLLAADLSKPDRSNLTLSKVMLSHDSGSSVVLLVSLLLSFSQCFLFTFLKASVNLPLSSVLPWTFQETIPGSNERWLRSWHLQFNVRWEQFQTIR
ncbi:hypothetical protein MRB53_031143 [Persea americana]|uniref:Uncharacterized protein n=1 Tax=Persea americana TaxID=3435 RepID=A0ACC2KN84_PERAE|nr:hypothetical protein MRB53_031143 [Persea americana]